MSCVALVYALLMARRYATCDVADLSDYGIGIAQNGEGTDGEE